MGLIILFLKFLCEVLHIRNIELTKSSTKLDITVHPMHLDVCLPSLLFLVNADAMHVLLNEDFGADVIKLSFW